jgi:hypothetical protein
MELIDIHAWYVTPWAAHEGHDGLTTYTSQAKQLLYPKCYPLLPNRLNKQIHPLLRGMNGLYKLLLEGNMSKTWRSTWLNLWLYGERWTCEHSQEAMIN